MEVKTSAMENVTLAALDSSNPFGTKIPPTRRLDGAPVEQIAPEKVQIQEPQQDYTRSGVIEEKPLENTPIPTAQEEKKRGRKKALAATEQRSNPIIETRSNEGLPSYRCEFAGRDIFVGWPWYKHSNPVTAAVQVAMALDFGRDKIRFDMAIGDAKIEHSRNRLAHKFLETDAKWMMMIDDDIIPSIGRPAWLRYWVSNARNLADLPLQRHVLHRLIGAGKTLVGAAYFGRQEGGALMCANPALAARAKAYDDAVVPVDWVGTGCMLIHRSVFEDMQKKFPELVIDVPDYKFDYFRPFDSARGEDVSFCIRAAQCGHQPHIDLGLPVFHVGYRCY